MVQVPDPRLLPSLSLPALLLVSLGAGLLAGCAQRELDDPLADPLGEQRGELAAAHEPQLEIFWRRFRAFTPWTFTLSGLDRPFRLSYNWWSNGTELPSLFRMIATSPAAW